MKILATYNIKGGVGKTAAAVNIAYLAAREGYRTLIWDLDPQGAASFYFRIKPKVKGGGEKIVSRGRALDDVVKATDYDNLDLVPADFSYRNLDLMLSDAKRPTRELLKLMRPLSEQYDVLILDTAPSISLVSENVFHAGDGLIIPFIPTTLSVRTHRQLLKFFSKRPAEHLKLFPFFSMVDRRKNMHTQLMEELPKEFPEILDSAVPYASIVERMGVERAPLAAYAPNSDAAKAYEAVWAEISESLWAR